VPKYKRFLLFGALSISMLSALYAWTGWYRARHGLVTYVATVLVVSIAVLIISLRLLTAEKK
jgi:hypothetical protein